MRILITSGIYPPDVGGPATYVPAIGRGLRALGHSVTVITTASSLKSRSTEIVDFGTVIRLPRRGPRLGPIISRIWSIAQTARQSDVILCNGLILESILSKVFHRKPVIIKVVGDLAWERSMNYGWTTESIDIFQKKRGSIRVELLKFLRNWLVGHADGIVVPSHYLERIVKEWGVLQDRISVIKNAIPPLKTSSCKKTWNITKKTIITVARLVKWKGVGELVEVISRFPNVTLTIVGDGPEESNLRSRVDELGIGDRVNFRGRQVPSATEALIAASDLFILNSSYEGLPHVVLESIAIGTPVVARASGGTDEAVLPGSGLLYGEGGLEAALHEALSGNSFSSFESARAQVLQEFSAEKMATSTAATLLRSIPAS